MKEMPRSLQSRRNLTIKKRQEEQELLIGLEWEEGEEGLETLLMSTTRI